MKGRAAVRSGLGRMAGFGIGMLLLAVSALVSIPTMVKVSGASGWAAVAFGQAVGAVAAVAIAYGWMLAGPAAISRGTDMQRRTEYLESLRTRGILLLPVLLVAVSVSVLLVDGNWLLATLGCVTAASTGLSASWFYVGTGRPYSLLGLETLPRVMGTVVGIFLMEWTGTAAAGLVSQIIGMGIGLLACSVSILATGRGRHRPKTGRPRSVRVVLAAQRHGVTSSVVSMGYGAAAITVVSMVVPGLLPQYAVLDKIQKQLGAALSPFVQVWQGWVPRASAADLRSRARTALLVTFCFALALFGALAYLGDNLISWLSSGVIAVPGSSILLASAFISLCLVESVTSKAGLVPYGLIARVAQITTVSSVIGLAFTVAGAFVGGLNGVLIGLITGILTRIGWELVVLANTSRDATRLAPVSPAITQPDVASVS